MYVVSQTEYSNILGIFTNVRQCRKYILTLTNQENILLHEIRLNEPEKGRIDMTKLLTIKEADLKNMEKQQAKQEYVLIKEIFKIGGIGVIYKITSPYNFTINVGDILENFKIKTIEYDHCDLLYNSFTFTRNQDSCCVQFENVNKDLLQIGCKLHKS